MSQNSFFYYAPRHRALLKTETSVWVVQSSVHRQQFSGQRDTAGTCEKALETQKTHRLYKHVSVAAELWALC